MKWPLVSRKKHEEETNTLRWRLEDAQRNAACAETEARKLYECKLSAAVENLPDMQEEVNMLANLHCSVSGEDHRMRGEILLGLSISISRQFIQRAAGIEGAIEYIAKHCGGEVRRGMLDPKQINVAGAIAEALK